MGPVSSGSPFRCVSSRNGLAVSGVYRLIIRSLFEACSVVREDHVAREIPQAEAQYVLAPNGSLNKPRQVSLLGWSKTLSERAPTQEWLHCSLGNEHRLGPSFGDSSLLGLGAIADPERHTE